MHDHTHNTKQIKCPEHPHSDHTATLYLFGHKYAGIWECAVEGVSDSCTHESLSVEIATDDHLGFNGHFQTESSVYVCDACECTVDGDPAADAAEAVAEFHAELAMGH